MKSYKKIKKEIKRLWSIANSGAMFRWTAFKLSLSVFLYDSFYSFRGLSRCPHHGYCEQSFWTGYCKECKEVPNPPPLEAICTMCGEEVPIMQVSDPNGGKELWSICWECDQFIQWAFLHSSYLQLEVMGANPKPLEDFPEWLFKTQQVYPKHESTSYVLKKKRKLILDK